MICFDLSQTCRRRSAAADSAVGAALFVHVEACACFSTGRFTSYSSEGASVGRLAAIVFVFVALITLTYQYMYAINFDHSINCVSV